MAGASVVASGSLVTSDVASGADVVGASDVGPSSLVSTGNVSLVTTPFELSAGGSLVTGLSEEVNPVVVLLGVVVAGCAVVDVAAVGVDELETFDVGAFVVGLTGDPVVLVMLVAMLVVVVAVTAASPCSAKARSQALVSFSHPPTRATAHTETNAVMFFAPLL